MQLCYIDKNFESKSFTKAKKFLLTILGETQYKSTEDMIKKIQNYRTKQQKQLSPNTLKLLIYVANRFF
jgi:aspartate/glutamate racemase